MMSRLLAGAVAATLLMHAVVGCCWHHEHVELPRHDEPSIFKPVVCGGHSHSHSRSHSHSHHDADEAPATPDNHHHDGDSGCGSQDCQFVKAEVQQGHSPLDGPVVATLAASLQLQAGGLRYARRDEIASLRPPSVALHLLHQVLVV